jgi:hypothetical protein
MQGTPQSDYWQAWVTRANIDSLLLNPKLCIRARREWGVSFSDGYPTVLRPLRARTGTLPVHLLPRRFAQVRTHESNVFAKYIKSIGMRERHPQSIQ